MNHRYISLKQQRNESKLCRNPHKGWYHHYYDNGLANYGSLLKEGDFLEDFSGLNHIYLRLAWSYLEPEEGKFSWGLLDKVIAPWVSHGYKIAFRITCKETAMEPIFATPEWVMQKGAKGEFHTNIWTGKWSSWEPDYGDPVFLDQLENFHKAFAERYDNKTWVEYIDIGSYGDWGEGHTQAGSKKDWPAWVLKEHVDLHQRHYKKSVLVINDDHTGCRYIDVASKPELLDYFVKKDLALRDDSVCVKLYQDNGTGYSTLRFPEMFDLFWRRKPVDIELDHYMDVKRYETWKDGFPLLAAVEESHATFIGFHGDARLFLAENPELIKRLANRAGYWYAIKGVEIPEKTDRGTTVTVCVEWQNIGVAPCYYRYDAELIIEGINKKDIRHRQLLGESDNRKWMPGEVSVEKYAIEVPASFEAGVYKIKIGLFERQDTQNRPIELALHDKIRDRDGYYEVADMMIG
jgi:hypothetical protein